MNCLRCKKDSDRIYVNGMCHSCTKVTGDFAPVAPDPNDPGLCLERPVYRPTPKREGWLHSPSACTVGGCDECKNVSDK